MEPQQASATAAAGVNAPDPAHELWGSYWSERRLSTRNDLILAYEPLVRSVVSRLPANVRSYWEADDLRSFGLLGLVEAIERWERDSAVGRFPAYARKRIRGAIFDELRRLDWLPRTVRRRVIAYRTTVDTLSSELGRNPELHEVLSEMGAQGEANDVLAEVHSAQLLHLHHVVRSEIPREELRLVDLIASEGGIEPELHVLRREQLDEVRDAISGLPERQRTVVTLRFFAGMTQEQIGMLIGVTNSRVCQIEASAIQTLRRILATSDGRRCRPASLPA